MKLHSNKLQIHQISREFGCKGVHVAHIIIDGTILKLDDAPKESTGKDNKWNFVNPDNADPTKKMNPNHIADTYYFLSQQEKTCWTQELDIRPSIEKW